MLVKLKLCFFYLGRAAFDLLEILSVCARPSKCKLLPIPMPASLTLQPAVQQVAGRKPLAFPSFRPALFFCWSLFCTFTFLQILQKTGGTSLTSHMECSCPLLRDTLRGFSGRKRFRFRDARMAEVLFLIAGACVLYALGRLGSEFFLQRISSVALLAGFVWTFWGTHRLRHLSFPLLLLATMVPLPTVVYNALSTHPCNCWHRAWPPPNGPSL